MDIIRFYLTEDDVSKLTIKELSAYVRVMSVPMLMEVASYVKDNPSTESSTKLIEAHPIYINSMVAYLTIEELAQRYKIFEFQFYELYDCILEGRFTAGEYKECVDTIVSLEDKLEYQFNPRTIDEYNKCLSAVGHLPLVKDAVRSYKELFYTGPREEPRKTPMVKFLSKMRDLKLQQKCISYLDKLISMHMRPEEVPL